MRSRKDILLDLINFKKGIKELEIELKEYSWDSEKIEVIVSNKQMVSVLNRFVSGKISKSDFIDWANALECRDDIDYNDDRLQDIICELATPELYGGISIHRINEIIESIS